MNTTRTTTVILGALALAASIAACSPDSTPPGTSAPHPQEAWAQQQREPFNPNEVGKSAKGEFYVTINSVQDGQTAYGPATLFTFTIANEGNQTIVPFDWSTPTLVQGTTAVENIVSGADGNIGYGLQGPIPPGSAQTVTEAYKIPKAALTDAVLSEGSIVWRGDFTTHP